MGGIAGEGPQHAGTAELSMSVTHFPKSQSGNDREILTF